MLTVIASGKLLPLTKERGTSIKIAPSPFSDQGACRWPYWASMDGRCCVVKRFRENSSEASLLCLPAHILSSLVVRE